MSPYYFILFIPLLPLLVFFMLGLFGRKYIGTSSGMTGVISLLITTLLSLYTAYQYFFIDGKVNGIYQHIHTT